MSPGGTDVKKRLRKLLPGLLVIQSLTVGMAVAQTRPAVDVAFVHDRPVMTDAVVVELTKELHQREIADGIATLKNAKERLACQLVQIARVHGETNSTGVRLNMRLSRRDLGSSVGVGPETTIRTVSRWQRDALLSTKDQIIEIHDLAALLDIAGCNPCQFSCSVAEPSPE